VEYGDYECPHCGRAYPIIKALQRLFGPALRFVYRNFPLTEVHPHAQHAAEAAESVGAHAGENAFWRMHDILFERQWDSLEDDALIRYAAEAGADPRLVAADLASGAFEERVREDFMSGVRSGVNGTPTLFINGERFDGDWSNVDEFAEALREAASAARA
jgi:protein-disulfide isomerase